MNDGTAYRLWLVLRQLEVTADLWGTLAYQHFLNELLESTDPVVLRDPYLAGVRREDERSLKGE